MHKMVISIPIIYIPLGNEFIGSKNTQDSKQNNET